MPKAKVYLDANVFKFSATQLPRLRSREVTINWGGREQSVTLHDSVTVNPNEGIENPELKGEAELLPQVAALGGTGRVVFVTSFETKLEVWGLPDLDTQTGYFYGAHIEIVDAPVQYSRIVFGAGDKTEDNQGKKRNKGKRTNDDDYKQTQLNFLRSLTYPRFLELQRITGAYQGESAVNRNQLLDAFHLWCAEHNGCDFFLSLDFKLANIIRKATSKPLVPVVRPSELLRAVRAGN